MHHAEVGLDLARPRFAVASFCFTSLPQRVFVAVVVAVVVVVVAAVVVVVVVAAAAAAATHDAAAAVAAYVFYSGSLLSMSRRSCCDLCDRCAAVYAKSKLVKRIQSKRIKNRYKKKENQT